MSTLRAVLINGGVSAIVVAIAYAAVRWLWYPSPLFAVLGAGQLFLLIVLATVVLGPLLTAIVYRRGKRGLAFDLAALAALQVAALVYGLRVLYVERPCYMVFSVDRFEALSCDAVDGERVAARVDLTQKPWHGPYYVIAELPADADERNRLLAEVVFEGKPDLPQRVEYWQRYSGEALERVRRRATPVADAALDASLASRAVAAAGPDALLLPMVARRDLVTLVVDPASMRPVSSLPVEPGGGPAK